MADASTRPARRRARRRRQLNAHGIIRRVAHEAQTARLGLVRELGTDHFRLLVPASMTQVLSDLSTQLSSSTSGKAIRSHESMGRAAVGRQSNGWPKSRREGLLRGLTITKHNSLAKPITCVWAQVGSITVHYDYGGAAIVSYRNS